jgi:hypothetical protein
MLRSHAELDSTHAADIYSLLDSLPLSTLHAQLVGISALHTLAMLESFFHNLAPAVSRPTVSA